MLRVLRAPACRMGATMAASSGQAADMLIRKLRSIVEIGDAEQRAIEALPVTLRDYGADREVARQGDRPTQSCLLVTGFMFRYKVVGEGRRQIFSFHTPG